MYDLIKDCIRVLHFYFLWWLQKWKENNSGTNDFGLPQPCSKQALITVLMAVSKLVLKTSRVEHSHLLQHQGGSPVEPAPLSCKEEPKTGLVSQMPTKEHPVKADNHFLDFICSCHYSPRCCWCFDGSYSAHSLLWAQVLCSKHSFSLKPVSPQPVQFRGILYHLQQFSQKFIQKVFTLCILFILNKRHLRDAKTHTCKCSKSNNSKQVSFLMEESLLDTASCQTRKRQCNCKGHQSQEKSWWFFYSIVQGEYYIFLHTPL